MTQLQQLNLLIDKASSIAGGDAALAKMLGVTRQRVYSWRAGLDSCSPEDQALMAGVAGLDPVAELARAVLAKHQGTPKGDRLLKVLGKASLATGAAVASVGAHASAISSILPSFEVIGAAWGDLIRCILC